MADQAFELYTGSATGAQIDNAAAKVAAMEETLSGTAGTIPSSAAVKNYVDGKLADTESTLLGNAVYDISEANNGTTYVNLAAALNNGNNIPASIRKGGISIKFIQSSDNKYVRFNYLLEDATTNSKFTNVANWQGVDDKPTANSENLVKSGGVVDAIGKRGVISQRQTWTSDFSSYTMSNIVIGIIPQSAIDLYEEAGATFNENGYQTGVGYFEMNGITDLSYQNIKDAYDFSYHNNGLWTHYLNETKRLPRTNFPLCNGIDFEGGIPHYNRAISLHLFYLYGLMEVLRLSRVLRGEYGASISQYSGYLFYYNSQTIREVMGVMDIYNAATGSYFFSRAPQLKTVKFRGLNSNIDLKQSHVLSLDSVVYMVQNSANKSAVTISLHADVYAVCQADTTEYTYQGNTYTGIIALATAKNITIATA